MRILAVYRHYWPDTTPYARLLKAILEDAAAAGHTATVVSAQPSYNDAQLPAQPRTEEQGGVAIRRVRLLPERKRFRVLRLLNSLLFLGQAVGLTVWRTMTRRSFDVILANGHPPVLMGLALWLTRLLTGTPYMLHLQDIHPECLASVGKLRRGRLFRWLRAVDAFCCRRAARLVTLSTDMAAALVERGLDRERIVLIQNAPLRVETGESAAVELPPELQRRNDETLLLFAGNLGDFQALDLLVDATRQVGRDRSLRLVLLGSGAAKSRLMQRAGDCLGRSIQFVDRVNTPTAVAAMRAADYGVVSLAPGVSRYAFPSKSMTLLAAGCPLAVIAEPDSELSQTTVGEQLGLASSGYDTAAVATLLHEACERRDLWTLERRSELAVAGQRLYGEQRMLAAWSTLWNELASAAPTPVAGNAAETLSRAA